MSKRKKQNHRPRQFKNTETLSPNNLRQQHSNHRILKLIEDGKLGSAIIAQLVAQSNVQEDYKPVISAIGKTLQSKLVIAGVTSPDIITWANASILAAYELGVMVTKVPSPKKREK